MSKAHVTVIGAGIVGVCCALHLQRLGYRVTLVDQRLTVRIGYSMWIEP